MPRPTHITVTLDAAELAALNLPANGNAGGQAFLRKLQGMVQPDGTITLSDAEVGKIVRYAGYSQGGFQGRFKDAFGSAIRDAVSR